MFSLHFTPGLQPAIHSLCFTLTSLFLSFILKTCLLLVPTSNGFVPKNFPALQNTTKPIPASVFSYRFASPTSNQTPYYVSSDIVLRWVVLPVLTSLETWHGSYWNCVTWKILINIFSKESCKEGEGVDRGIALPHFSRVEFCRAPGGMNNV